MGDLEAVRRARERDEAVADAIRLRCDYASVEHDCARLITAIRESDVLRPDVDLRELADEIESHGREGWVAKTLAQHAAVGRDTHALCDRTITEQRVTIERLTRERDDLLAGGRQTSREIDTWREALGAADDEMTLDAIKRVRAEAAYERAQEQRADASIAAAWKERDAALGERDSANALAIGARAELADAKALSDEMSRGYTMMSETALSVGRERDAALERCGYYERGNIPRLLGIAPDQLATVRAVLWTARWVPVGHRVTCGWVNSGDDCTCPRGRFEAALAAYDAAGRPMAGEVE